MRKDFQLYKRKLKSGTAYYVKFWNNISRKHVETYSVGVLKNQLGRKAIHLPHTSKAGANAIVRMWIEEGQPIGEKELFLDYLENFWRRDSDYVLTKRMREESISIAYIDNNRSAIKAHIKPFLIKNNLENIFIHQVTPEILEKLLKTLSSKDIGNSRINAIYKAVTVPLSYAQRLGKIKETPARNIKKLPVKKVRREIFTINEARSFFQKQSENPDKRFLGINMLSASTGLRLGECVGLLKENVMKNESEIKVATNWQPLEGLKNPKWDSFRSVPVPAQTMKILLYLIENGIRKNDPFIFFNINTLERPIGHHSVEDNFNKTCNEIGIDEDTRKMRNLTFHCWRHWFDSMLDGKISDKARRDLTGHENDKMDRVYLHITEEQKKAITDVSL